MKNSEQLSLTTPKLPSGGGAISGIKGDIASAGPDGATSFTLPLPVSAGRGYAPPLALSYHSRSGNSFFGIGWNINLPAVRRRTNKGTPAYDENDEFLGPDGEVLVQVLNTEGDLEVRSTTTLLSTELGETFSVYTYRSRTENDFSRLEFWKPISQSESGFWVIYSTDGQVHLMGRNSQSRISHPQKPSQIAVWLAESSVSATGEQIYWQYRAEDDADCEESEKSNHADVTVQRYLTAVWYGNKVAARKLPALVSDPLPADWLFTLVFDYGERGTNLSVPPDWQEPGSGEWPCRKDCFSGYEYGFEIRTRRLCRQVLIYHDVASLLAGETLSESVPFLVSRVMLTYVENASITTLKTVQHIAYEPDETPVTLPPLTLNWQDLTLSGVEQWQKRSDMGKYNLLQPYQMVDLNGEGTAGILYQNANAWWYRAPVRDLNGGKDGITWDKPIRLPVIPSLRDGGTLADLNGDGYLEWVYTAIGTAGRYQQTAEHSWSRFVPFKALPVEYSHIRAQLADIVGAGFSDIVLIGPKSVRLYSGTDDGWKPARVVLQSDDIILPQFNSNDKVMVAFSDMAGSGQQHLTEVRADGVSYWPNLGNGLFGRPIKMTGFSQPAESFNPEQLYLADVDGSGTTDLIYALSDKLLVWINQSGNQFAEPVSISLPEGVCYDRTCSLQLADIQGLGIASLVLTIPHPEPSHWTYHLMAQKPWLLKGINNNMGVRHTLTYRSSAQFWLDEKAENVSKNKPVSPCYLPFVMHTLSCTEVMDEITGNNLVSTVRYRCGAWDRREREFRGFGFVEISDSDIHMASGTEAAIAMPAISRTWYATGLQKVDESLQNEYWSGDDGAFAVYQPRFTTGSGNSEQIYIPDDETKFWLYRGLKGMLLRNELYGSDASSLAEIPYSVNENRIQVRLLESRGSFSIVHPQMVESRVYNYERISCDPQCSQQLLLSSDEYGLPLKQVSINYPRRLKPVTSPYPYTLPDTLFDSSYDDQQQVAHLVLTRNSWHNLSEQTNGIWMTGLSDSIRNDIYKLAAASIPAEGFILENLLTSEGPLTNEQSLFGGQQQTWYLDDQGEAATGNLAFPPRIHFNETAVFDEDIAALMAEDLTPSRLELAGYKKSPYLFAQTDELTKTLWTMRSGYLTYTSAKHFFRPITVQETLLTAKSKVYRDPFDCVITQTEDAVGLTVSAEYDWRFMKPIRVTDFNDNTVSLTFDALGRVTTSRFWGTENGKETGYSDSMFTQPATADAAISLAAPLPVNQCMVYVTDSWQEAQVDRLPPHVVVLTTDRYDNDPLQKIRQHVVFSDGFGRVLQTSVRQPMGEAWLRGEDGSLISGADASPAMAVTDFRWSTSGRTEYDNKGQAVRTYQPYFLDTWKYVSDDSARRDLYADTHCFDPLGREWQVITAKGFLKRTFFTPWFTVSEDENDAAAEADSIVL